MSDASITIALDKKYAPVFIAVGAGLGLAAAAAVGPVVAWMLATVDGAPAPLRLVDQLPTTWAIPLLMLAGGVVGWFIFAVWGEEVGTVTVTHDDVLISGSKTSASFSREEIAEAFLDKDELVLLDASSRELSRTSSDGAVAQRLAAAFERFGYLWAGTTDPRDGQFTPWVDRSRDLEAHLHELLRRRRRAMADGRTGEAEEARDELLAAGIVVRDRGEQQQYRRVDR